MITEIISGLKQGYDALQNEDFSKATQIFEGVLKKDKKNANAYVGKLLAEYGLKKISDLEEVNESFNKSENFKNAILYGGKDIISALEHCVSAANKRKELEAKNKVKEAELKKNEEERLSKLKEEEKKIIEKQQKLEKEQEQLVQNVRQSIKKGKKKKLNIIVSFSLIFVVSISCSAFFISKKVKKNNDLQHGQNLYDNGDYVNAYLIFKELGEDEKALKMKNSVELLSNELAEKGEYEKVFNLCEAMETEIPLLEAYKKVIDGKYKEAVSLGLYKITLPKGLKKVPSEKFCDCSELEEVIIPEGVTEIGAFSFEGCVSLKKVILPQSLELIDENAFHGCVSLEEITIPKSTSFIGRMAFSKCNSLTKATFEDKNGWIVNGKSYSFSTAEQEALSLKNDSTENWIKKQ